MATIDEQFVLYIINSIVDYPDDVKIERSEDERGTLLSLTVNPEDLGRVIGKRGVTAQSIRSLLRALGMKNNAHYNLKIIDVDRPEGESVVKNTTYGSTENTSDVENSTEEGVENTSDLAKKTRAELADLDDLDI
jgi:predicted RNA-binding protein YlqC (UPF0109 family)